MGEVSELNQRERFRWKRFWGAVGVSFLSLQLMGTSLAILSFLGSWAYHNGWRSLDLSLLRLGVEAGYVFIGIFIATCAPSLIYSLLTSAIASRNQNARKLNKMATVCGLLGLLFFAASLPLGLHLLEVIQYWDWNQTWVLTSLCAISSAVTGIFSAWVLYRYFQLFERK